MVMYQNMLEKYRMYGRDICKKQFEKESEIWIRWTSKEGLLVVDEQCTRDSAIVRSLLMYTYLPVYGKDTMIMVQQWILIIRNFVYLVSGLLRTVKMLLWE